MSAGPPGELPDRSRTFSFGSERRLTDTPFRVAGGSGGREDGELGMALHAYVWFVVAVGFTRLAEAAVGASHLKWVRARGGLDHPGSLNGLLATLQVLLLIGCILEADLSMRPFVPALAWPMFVVVLVMITLRWWSIFTLGPRWTTGVVLIPGLPPVRRGPYRVLRHPAALATGIEGVALALMWGSWLTAAVFAVGYTAIAMLRLRAENRALTIAYPS